MRKLSHDENEELAIVLRSHGWSPLLKLIDQLCGDQDKRVLTYNLSEGAEGLIIAKARTEGARLLQQRIVELKNQFTKQGE